MHIVSIDEHNLRNISGTYWNFFEFSELCTFCTTWKLVQLAKILRSERIPTWTDFTVPKYIRNMNLVLTSYQHSYRYM